MTAKDVEEWQGTIDKVRSILGVAALLVAILCASEGLWRLAGLNAFLAIVNLLKFRTEEAS
jgi:Zn-dependent protease